MISFILRLLSPYPPCALFVVRDELKVEVLLRRRHRHLDDLLRLLRQLRQHLWKEIEMILESVRNIQSWAGGRAGWLTLISTSSDSTLWTWLGWRVWVVSSNCKRNPYKLSNPTVFTKCCWTLYSQSTVHPAKLTADPIRTRQVLENPQSMSTKPRYTTTCPTLYILYTVHPGVNPYRSMVARWP